MFSVDNLICFHKQHKNYYIYMYIDTCVHINLLLHVTV